MRRLVWLFLILLAVAPAIADEPMDYDSMTANVKLSNIIEIRPRNADYQVDYVTARLSWTPRETYSQSVENIVVTPQSTMEGDELSFRWNMPRERELWIRVNGVVETSADYFPITNSVRFPLRDIPAGMSRYLREQEIIDFSPEIEKQAAYLANGKTDLYDVVFTIGLWVHNNINYTLDSLTADASQKSSWVLQEQRGVCDELTSLFISMLRSLGIPARFVYGQAYTDIATLDSWGAHGWAEVYFPGHGWVPFDVTYGEYGYVDAGHIKMGESIDSRRPSLKYTLKGRNADISSGYLDVDVDVLKGGKDLDPEISMSASFYEPIVGFGSYNLLTVTLKNDDDYYKPVSVRLAVPEEIKIDNPVQGTVVPPKQEARIHWLVRASSGLDSGFVYTFPFTVLTDRGARMETSFKADSPAQKFDIRVFESIMKGDKEEADKPYSKYIDLDCNPDVAGAYAGDTILLSCDVKNLGSKNIRTGEVCFRDECEDLKLGPGEKTSVSFSRTFTSPGVKNLIVTAQNGDFRKTSYSRTSIIDESSLDIFLDVPETINYGETVNVKFRLERTSLSTPKNVVVKLQFQDAERSWVIEDLDTPSRFDVQVGSDGFTYHNEFKITASYDDEVGKAYYQEEKFIIDLEDLSLKEQIIVSLNTLGYVLLSLFS